MQKSERSGRSAQANLWNRKQRADARGLDLPGSCNVSMYFPWLLPSARISVKEISAAGPKTTVKDRCKALGATADGDDRMPGGKEIVAWGGADRLVGRGEEALRAA